MSPSPFSGRTGTVAVAMALVLSSLAAPVALTPGAVASSSWVTTTEANFNGGGRLFQDCAVKGSGADARIELNISDTGVWNLMNVSASPPGRSGHAMAAIGSTDKILLFGGLSYDGTCQTILDDTWVYDSGDNNWTKMSPSDKPPARWLHQMATIWNDDRVVLFGGWGIGGALGDTWVYDQGDDQWYNRTPAASPYQRYGHAMASVMKDSTVVLFGGRMNSSHLGFSDTWTFDQIKDQWKQVSPGGSPARRWGPSIAAVWNDDKLLMYGGTDGANYPKDTWVYDLSENRWTKKNPPHSPSACDRMATATLFHDDTVMLFGGLSYPPVAVYDETWTYDIGGVSWSQMSIPDRPPARDYLAMAAVNNTRKVVLFGGENFYTGITHKDTWVYDAAIYVSTGIYSSPRFDFGKDSTLISIGWNASTPNGTSVGFQIRAAGSWDELEWAGFIGPDGTSDTFYSKESVVDHILPGVEWFQYKAVLQTQNLSLTPVLNDVTIRYNMLPAAPVLTGPKDDGWLSLNRPEFTWTFRDDDSSRQGGFEWQLDAAEQFTPYDYSSGEVESNASSFTPGQPIADGIWHWRVRTRDLDGDWGPFSGGRTIKLDATPPKEFTLEANPGGWTSIAPEISFSTSDRTSGMDHYELSLDGGVFEACESPCVLAELSDGPHEIVVRAFDRAGNHADANVKVLMDRTAPRPFTPTAEPATWTSGPVQVSFSTEDNTSGIDHYLVKLDRGEFDRQDSPLILPELPEGEHSITIQALDRAGNFMEGRVSVFVDRTVPDSLVLMTVPAGWTREDPTVSFRATDRPSQIGRFEASVDGGAFEAKPGAFTVTGLSDGVHIISVRAYDAAGNYIEGETRAYIDRAPPLAFDPVASPDGWTRSRPVVSFSTTDAVCATVGYEIAVDNGSFNKVTSPWSMADATDGQHSITVRAYDEVRNVREGHATIYYDRAAPYNVSLAIDNGSRTTHDRHVRLTVRAGDNSSGPDGMCFSGNGRDYTEWEPFMAARNWTFPSGYGEKTIYVKVRDQAGNEARAVSANITVTVPPQYELFSENTAPVCLLALFAILAVMVVYLFRPKDGRTRRRGPDE